MWAPVALHSPFNDTSDLRQAAKLVDSVKIVFASQTLELEESQRDAEELGGVMGPGRGKVMQASKGAAQKGWQHT